MKIVSSIRLRFRLVINSQILQYFLFTGHLVQQDAMTRQDAIFPYFSSLAYTKAASLLAISQAANIDINNKFKYN